MPDPDTAIEAAAPVKEKLPWDGKPAPKAIPGRTEIVNVNQQVRVHAGKWGSGQIPQPATVIGQGRLISGRQCCDVEVNGEEFQQVPVFDVQSAEVRQQLKQEYACWVEVPPTV